MKIRDAWEPATFSGDRPFVGTDQPFAHASDDRMWAITPSTEADARPIEARHLLAVAEQQQRRDAHHPEALWRLGVLVDVDLVDRQLAAVLAGEGLQARLQRVARRAGVLDEGRA